MADRSLNLAGFDAERRALPYPCAVCKVEPAYYGHKDGSLLCTRCHQKTFQTEART